MHEDVDFAVIGYPYSANIGDEIQSIAAAQLLPRVDRYLPREHLNDVEVDKPIKLLCNGFFMYRAQNWPPAEGINPLFISLHVSGEHRAESLADPGLKPYYERFGPIGARDKKTERLFIENGHDAYFSACVTLTLKNPHKEEDRTDEILLVDPFYKYPSQDYQRYLSESIIPPSAKSRVVELTHTLPKDHGFSEEEKIAKAKALLDRYARASLVITSRIHCALPCLGLGTPVLFIENGYDRKFGRERFGGILELFNVIDPNHFPLSSRKPFGKLLRFFRLHRLFPVKPLPIDFDHPPVNKEYHLKYAENIRRRVAEWIEEGIENNSTI